jgi:threonine/homoserine/homoserine lactone efflux protein
VLGEAIGDLLPSAVGVALSPVPIVAVILMLGTPRARSNGLAFAAGWVVGLVAVGVIVLLVAGDADSSGDTSTAVDVVVLLFGVLLLAVAVKQWRGRPRAGETPERRCRRGWRRSTISPPGVRWGSGCCCRASIRRTSPSH